ncbi:MAG TPA: serine/threonine-protein kinase [Streptosporangiaceae bacterium]|nr:serine/threonine-protein kinase [Streptosporangiaceae bacterium]
MSDQDPQDFRVGSMVAGYRLEERIGQGGMAVVFRAYDARLDRRVALKIMAPGLAADEAFRQRFIRESRAAAAVDDPHIIPVFEAGESDGVLFIAMRYVRGGDVRSLIGRVGPLGASRVAEIVAQVASALDAAHAIGLVHRDVKPANMLLEPSTDADRPEHAYLSDFGLSKGTLAATGLTATGQFLGTLDYVSPEQIEGRAIDGRADVYALACSTFEMLCGEPPFLREQGVSVMYAHLSEPPPSVRARRPELPAGIDEVLAKAMAKAPADRYATCRDFAAALRLALGSGPASPEPQVVGHPATEVVAVIASGTVAAELSPTSAAPESSPTSVAPVWSKRSGPPQDEPAGSWAETGSRRSWWRSPAGVAGICVLAVVLAGGGFLAARGHGGGGPGRPASSSAKVLTPPGCTTATARAANLTGVVAATTPLSGGPFGVAVSADGRYSFVATGNAVAVLRAGSGLAPSRVRTISVPGAKKGLALTPDGRYLVVADGSGAAVLNVANAEDGAAAPFVGSLTSPGGSGAVEVLISSDGKFAFVTLQNSAQMAVFNLADALAHGFSSQADFLGSVPLAAQPVGMASDGTWLYVVSLTGSLAVVNIKAAEANRPHAVAATVPAGCGAARALLTSDGKVLWVTARQSDALLAFSTARLRTDAKHALIARVMVGETPLGEALLDNGSRIVVADANLHNLAGVPSNLAVISTASALSGKPALLGYVPVGQVPREIAVEPGGKALLVTVQGAHELEAVSVGSLR